MFLLQVSGCAAELLSDPSVGIAAPCWCWFCYCEEPCIVLKGVWLWKLLALFFSKAVCGFFLVDLRASDMVKLRNKPLSMYSLVWTLHNDEAWRSEYAVCDWLWSFHNACSRIRCQTDWGKTGWQIVEWAAFPWLRLKSVVSQPSLCGKWNLEESSVPQQLTQANQ